jgi:hypothetical protein
LNDKSFEIANQSCVYTLGDPQVLEMEEFEQLKEVMKDVKKTIASFPKEIPVHAISAGDNVFDKLLFTINTKN